MDAWWRANNYMTIGQIYLQSNALPTSRYGPSAFSRRRAGRPRSGWRRSAPQRQPGQFWHGHLDLDALAFDITEHLADMADAHARIDRATVQARRYWRRLYCDDELLLSVPGDGAGHRVCGPPRRHRPVQLREGGGQLCRVEPVDLVLGHGVPAQPSDHQRRASRAAGAFFQSANGARRRDPQLAAFYHRLMTEHGHCHTQASVAVGRKLVERSWTVLTRGQLYQLRDLDGRLIAHPDAKKIIKDRCTAPDHIRTKARATARPPTAPS